MNCKIVIFSLIALWCIQLIEAKGEGEPLRRSRSKRVIRSSSQSKSLRKSRTFKPTNTTADDSESNSPDTSNSLDDRTANLMKTLSGLGLAGNGRTDLPKNAKIADGIPLQQAKRSVIIEGKNGKIFIDKVAKYTFHGDKVSIEIRDGNFYVNNNLVVRKGPRDLYGFVIYSMHELNYRNVSSFRLEIDPEGFMHYKDNTGENLNVNYFTRINFG